MPRQLAGSSPRSSAAACGPSASGRMAHNDCSTGAVNHAASTATIAGAPRCTKRSRSVPHAGSDRRMRPGAAPTALQSGAGCGPSQCDGTNASSAPGGTVPGRGPSSAKRATPKSSVSTISPVRSRATPKPGTTLPAASTTCTARCSHRSTSSTRTSSSCRSSTNRKPAASSAGPRRGGPWNVMRPSGSLRTSRVAPGRRPNRRSQPSITCGSSRTSAVKRMATPGITLPDSASRTRNRCVTGCGSAAGCWATSRTGPTMSSSDSTRQAAMENTIATR